MRSWLEALSVHYMVEARRLASTAGFDILMLTRSQSPRALIVSVAPDSFASSLVPRVE
jgi:hypothetical protein